MNYSALDVIRIAKSQVGYLEKNSNSNLDSPTGNSGYNNYTKYARDFDQKWPTFYNGKKQGAQWCDMLVDWCHMVAAGEDIETARYTLCQPLKSAGAGCYYSGQYYKAAGRWGQTPSVGDQIFFNDFSHTGVVYAVDSTYVYTIEGNTSGASGVVSNGGGCAMKSYRRSSGVIDGYGHPRYTATSENSSSAPASSTAKTLKYYSPYRKYQNGSTPEPVYRDSDMTMQNGKLNAYETAWCMGRYGSAYLVLYKLDGYADNWVTGYVGYSGGIEV